MKQIGAVWIVFIIIVALSLVAYFVESALGANRNKIDFADPMSIISFYTNDNIRGVLIPISPEHREAEKRFTLWCKESFKDPEAYVAAFLVINGEAGFKCVLPSFEKYLKELKIGLAERACEYADMGLAYITGSVAYCSAGEKIIYID